MDDWKKDVSSFFEKCYEVEAIFWILVISGIAAYAVYLAWAS